TPCGLNTVTAGISATNLHFFLRPTSPPYYETMFKIMPAPPSVNRRILSGATYFATATLIVASSFLAHALPRGVLQFSVNFNCKVAIQATW
ncbi:MAG: hypothetical protein Q8R89_12130, partial [Desulfomicrobium sp.]|nr:hypothetical protein [Desulfomicrobium sp.]